MTANLIAVIGSVTTAVRLEKYLHKKHAVSSKTFRTPSELGASGCSYSIKTKGEHLPLVIECAKDLKIKIKGIYFSEFSDGKEVYHALS